MIPVSLLAIGTHHLDLVHLHTLVVIDAAALSRPTFGKETILLATGCASTA